MTDRVNDREYGNFTMNYAEGSGRWRGVIKVPVRDGEGKVLSWVERRYIGVGPKVADSGTEYISLYVKGKNPMDAARERNLPVHLATNQPASYVAQAVNRGTLFIPTKKRQEQAEAEGKSLPAAQGYLLIPIEGKPTYVEVGSWPRSRKVKTGQVVESNNGVPLIDFYSGPAEIHDPALALARKLAKTTPGHDAVEQIDMTPAGFIDVTPELNDEHAAELSQETSGPNQAGPRKRRIRTEPSV